MIMTLRRLAIVMLLAAVAVSAADPTMLGYVMPDAKVIAGMNADTARNSPFGQYLLAQIQDDEGLKKLVASTGFDPRRDLREAIVASTSSQPHSGGIVIVRGNIDKNRIVEHGKAEGAALSSYKGVEILSGAAKKSGQSGGVAFVGPDTLVAGNLTDLQAAVDRKGGKISFDAGLLAQVNSLSAVNDAWFVSTGGAANLPGNLPLPGGAQNGISNALQGVQQTAGGVKFGANVMVSVEAVTRSVQDATALADVVRFLAGMVQMNRDKPGAGQAAQFLDTMNLTTQANTVKLSFSMPENDFEKLVKPQGKAKTRKTSETI